MSVSVEGLRSFMALLSDDDIGLFVSTGGFTKDAQELSRAKERRKVTLVDLERFFDLWVEHYGKLEDAARRKFPLQPIYFLAPPNRFHPNGHPGLRFGWHLRRGTASESGIES